MLTATDILTQQQLRLIANVDDVTATTAAEEALATIKEAVGEHHFTQTPRHIPAPIRAALILLTRDNATTPGEYPNIDEIAHLLAPYSR